MGAEILEFQLALLDDPALIEEALAQLSAGYPRHRPGSIRSIARSSSYEDADDEYFRARAGDLKDVGVRVGRALGGMEDRPVPVLPGAIVVAEDLTPSRFLSLDWSILGGGIALERGSARQPRSDAGQSAWRADGRRSRRGARER